MPKTPLDLVPHNIQFASVSKPVSKPGFMYLLKLNLEVGHFHLYYYTFNYQNVLFNSDVITK